MTPERDFPDRLPEEWLPPSVPPREDTDYWEAQLQRVLAAGEPALANRRRLHRAGPSWFDALANWWHPAAAGALALAASSVIALAVLRDRSPARDADAVTLAAIVSGGEPAALWNGAGLQADPSLALLALEGGTLLKETGR